MRKCKTGFIFCKPFLFLLLISWIAVVVGPVHVHAQDAAEKGLPFITNYSAKTYNTLPQTWSVQEDDRGMMYFGVQNYLLEYDGVKWRRIAIQNNMGASVVRSMAKSKDGTIYYGAFGDFGYLDYDSLGQKKTNSLRELIPANNRDFLDVWTTYVTTSGVYFQSREYIFRLDDKKPGAKQNSMMKVWKPQTKFMFAFYLDGNYYVHQQGLGLYKMTNDSLVLIPGSELLGKERMQVMLPYKSANNEKQYLVGLFYSGLYLFDGKTFQPFATKADSFIKTGSILYKGIQLRNGNYVLTTTGKGLVIIDTKGNLLQRINRDVGLQDESIYAPYEDKKGTLWLGLDNGISRAEIASPLTKFALQSGINTGVLAVTRFEDNLYIGTSNGLLVFNKTTSFFNPVPGIPLNQIFTLYSYKNQLLVPGDGLFSISNKKTSLIRASVSGDLNINSFISSDKFPGILLSGGNFGVVVFKKENTNNLTAGQETLKFVGYIPGINDQIWSFAENKDGTLWAGTQAGLAYRVSLAVDDAGNIDLQKTSFEKYGAEQGLKNGLGQAYSIKGINYFIADSSLYTFDEKLKRFVPDTTFGHFNKGGGNTEFDMVEDGQGRVWIRFGKELRVAFPKPGGGYRFDNNLLSSINELTIQKIFTDKNGIVWLGTTDGLIRYDEHIKTNNDQAFKIIIRAVSAGKIALSTIINPGEKPVAVSNKNNSLRFEYAAPFFEQEEKTTYQTWLEGFEKDWSAFNNNYYKEYTNLHPGDYQFHVRAKNIYQKISEDAVYTFSIHPPWYATWWAYVLYALAALSMVYLIIKWRTQQLQEKHRELEKTVADRTGQLSQRVEELAVITSVQEGLVREMDLQGIYELVGEKIREIFNAQVIDIVTYDKKNNLVEDKYVYENGDRSLFEPREPVGFGKHVIETGQLIVINEDLANKSIEYNSKVVNGSQQPKSAIWVPLITGNEVKGIISLQDLDKEHAYTNADVNLISTLANSMSMALESARRFHETTRLLAESKQTATELTTVNSISKALASKLDPDDLIKLVGDQLKNVFNANIIYIALLNQQSKIIHFPYQFGDEMLPMKLGEGLTSKIILTGEPLLINKNVDELTTRMGIQRIGISSASYLGVPIPVGEEILGVLSVQSTEQENRFNENDLRLLSTLGASVGVALRNATLFEEVKLAKLEAEAASKLAEKANEVKSAFLSTVSHELRTPLTSVLGFAKMIKKRLEERIFPTVDKTDAKIQKTVSQITENLHVVILEGERLTHLINDVLDLAKIEAGKMEFSQESVSLPEVAERAIAATSSLFEQKSLQLIKKIDREVPDIIGDKDKLIQVMINLISNSVKFTDSGSITCSIYQQNDELIASITDMGIGIAPEDFGAVFEQFKQVGGDTLTDKPKGTGLGLPICKEIVEHLGGRIWLESERGVGSTFSFALPLNKPSKSAPIRLDDLLMQLKEQVAHSKLLNQEVEASNILVVDDNDSIRSLLHQELGDAGYRIEEARNGKEALEKVRAKRPDLIILDIMMPEMNGFDAAAILKNDPETMDIPIIVLSVVQDKARGFRIGIDRYLSKPIDTGLLFSEIGSLLGKGKSKKKVIIVDEDSGAVRTLTEVLQAKGYEVMESVENELLEKAVANLPDIIIISAELSAKQEFVKTLRFEKGLENVLFVVYQ